MTATETSSFRTKPLWSTNVILPLPARNGWGTKLESKHNGCYKLKTDQCMKHLDFKEKSCRARQLVFGIRISSSTTFLSISSSTEIQYVFPIPAPKGLTLCRHLPAKVPCLGPKGSILDPPFWLNPLVTWSIMRLHRSWREQIWLWHHFVGVCFSGTFTR